MSPNWGWPEWTRRCSGDTPECECCLDCNDASCTTCLVADDVTGAEYNAFAWFADLCATLPNLDNSSNTNSIDMLQLSYQIDYVRVYQPIDAVSVGCDPPEFPTARWIADHEAKYRGWWQDEVRHCSGQTGSAAV